MSKRVDYVVAIILKKSGTDEILIVKRPAEDTDLANHWGLPAATMKKGELPEDCARRICVEKLGCKANPKKFIGLMFQKRNAYDLFLMDIEMELSNRSEPDIKRSNTSNTAYIEQKWTTGSTELLASANSGSCCSSIYLSDIGLLDKDKWIASLEGSDTVG
jgi:8-oxo-dGTP pyrophosphatase MutT (NUDIX family)